MCACESISCISQGSRIPCTGAALLRPSLARSLNLGCLRVQSIHFPFRGIIDDVLRCIREFPAIANDSLEIVAVPELTLETKLSMSSSGNDRFERTDNRGQRVRGNCV